MLNESRGRRPLPSRLDPICDRFESVWHSGGRPEIGVFLGQVDEPDRPALRKELLHLDIAWRRRRGESPQLADYTTALPGLDILLEHLVPRDDTVDTRACPTRFRVLRHHAKGGLGQVSVAIDEELNREVAFKEIQPHRADDAASRARFILEGEVTGGLEHPGIVPVYSLGADGQGRPFYAMRFIRGESLQEAIDRVFGKIHAGKRVPAAAPDTHDAPHATTVDFHSAETPKPIQTEPSQRSLTSRVKSASVRVDYASLEFRKLLQRFVDVCNAVAYAHSRGVIHRDIKPANIMLGPFGETILVDWGLAKTLCGTGDTTSGDGVPVRPKSELEQDFATQHGDIVGTPTYMSPEQALGEIPRIGPTSDIYSLGATLYTLLTGLIPVEGKSSTEVLSQVTAGEIVPPRARSPERRIPRPLEAICLKSMSLDPTNRYASAKDLAADIEHFLADEPVTACKDSLPVKSRRWIRKHRGVSFATIAVVLSAMVAGPFVAIREARLRAESDRNYADARQAIDRYVETVEESELLKEQRFKPLLKHLLEDAQGFYEGLMVRSEGRPDRLADLADSSYRVGVLNARSGSKEQAKPAYARAIEVFTRLAAENPTAARFQDGLAGSYNDLGVLQSETGDPSGAVVSFMSAIEIREKLAAENPTAAEFQNDLATSHNNLGNLQYATGDPLGAFVSFKSALTIQEQLAAENPTVTEIQSDLATSYNNLGVLQSETDDPQGAVSSLRSALTIRERIAAENPAVPDYQSSLAASYQNLGVLQRETGDPLGALASYQSGLNTQEKLAAENPTVTQFQRDLAASYYNLGRLQRETGDAPRALVSYRSALRIQEELAAEYSTMTEFQSLLAKTYDSVGSLLHKSGDSVGALANCHLALKIREKLAAENPTVSEFQSGLANGYNNLGLLKSESGDSQGALSTYQTALKIQEQLAAANPSVTQFHRELAMGYYNLGVLQAGTDDPRSALLSYQSALTITETLAAKNHAATDFQNIVAATLDSMAVAQSNLGRPDLARELFERAAPHHTAALAANPRNPQSHWSYRTNRGLLADVMLELEQHAAAAEILGHAVEWAVDASDLYDAACNSCRCMLVAGNDATLSPEKQSELAAAYADQAMELLKQAVAQGWKDAQRMKLDPLLEPLRARADFQQLVEAMEGDRPS